ncbi:MAG: bifunctional riboflavin kinase/FAD synthetase [Candidatus Nanopelagicales bacterium]|nr:bifunctional riboflavin kinase/FAD synthetase [Candidatus Nanopelagicales bacterium]
MDAPSPCVVTIGVFDGMHKGHRHLVQTARERAMALSLPLKAITFDPHPMAVVGRGEPPPSLAQLDHRMELLKSAGADDVEVLRFDSELAKMSPDDFAADVLVGRFGARAVVIGPDFRFGHRAAGDVVSLAAAGERLGFEVVVASPAGEGGQHWSSTLCRERIIAGDVRGAADVLGRPYRLVGEVVRGASRGADLGFPTANLALTGNPAWPADGVYAGVMRVVDGTPGTPDSGPWTAAISVGTNPQFNGQDRHVEVHAIDQTGLDLYGRRVVVDVIDRLRDQRVFSDIDRLVDQMGRDVAQSRALVEGALEAAGRSGGERLVPS